MDEKLYKELRNITDEEKEILQGRDNIDRRLYMEQQSDIINARDGHIMYVLYSAKR